MSVRFYLSQTTNQGEFVDIYAKAGHKVRYTGENGYDSQREELEAMGIKSGDALTVVYTDVGSWVTYVRFEEVSGLHNSVMFEDVA